MKLQYSNYEATYTVSDQDFDLSQFGMFLGTDQSIFQVHINDMVERIGRKLMTGRCHRTSAYAEKIYYLMKKQMQ